MKQSTAYLKAKYELSNCITKCPECGYMYDLWRIDYDGHQAHMRYHKRQLNQETLFDRLDYQIMQFLLIVWPFK